jgi:hypothetical protein
MLSSSPAIVPTRAEELFGTQNPARCTRADLLRFLAVAFACLLVSGLRRPDAFTNPQFWAEDGTVFFTEQQRLGWKAVVEPYAGYLHFLPRLVAGFADFFPIVHAPLIYNLAAHLILAVCMAWISLPAFRHLIRSDARRAFLALLFAASPIAGTGFHNITNIQWPLLLWAFLVALQPVEGRAARIALLLSYAITVMTAVCAVLFAPIWLLRALLVEKDRRYCAAMLAVLGLYAIVAKLCLKDPLYTATPPPLLDVMWMVPEMFVARVLVMATAGPYYIAKTVILTHFTIVLCGIGFLLGSAWLIRRLRHDRAFLLFMTAWIYAGIAILGLFALYRNVDIDIMCFTNLNDRYVLLGGLLTTAFWIALSERLDRIYNSTAITAAVVVLLVIAARSNFFFQPLQNFQWPLHAQKIEAARKAGVAPRPVPVNPEGWFIILKE